MMAPTASAAKAVTTRKREVILGDTQATHAFQVPSASALWYKQLGRAVCTFHSKLNSYWYQSTATSTYRRCHQYHPTYNKQHASRGCTQRCHLCHHSVVQWMHDLSAS